MFIKVILERIYEVDCELDVLGYTLEEIADMESLEMLDEDSVTITTEFKSICLMTEKETEQLQAEWGRLEEEVTK